MSLDDIVRVTITAETTAPSRTGFGLPLVMAYHTVWPERARIYSGDTAVDDMIADGFPSNHAAVRAVRGIMSQNPKPTSVVVGREENTQKQKIKITPDELIANLEYGVEIDGIGFSYTSDATPTVAEITAGLVADINPPDWVADSDYVVGDKVVNDTPDRIYVCVTAGHSALSGGPTGTGSGITDGTVVWDYVMDETITATDNTTDFDLEADTVADAFSFEIPDQAGGSIKGRSILKQENITPDGTPDGIAADISAVRAVNDDWYGLAITNLGKDVIEAAAAYTESILKLFLTSTADDEVYDPTVSDDVGSNLQAAAYARTAIMYHPKALVQYPGAAWLGNGLPYDPGSITWKFKTLAGVDYVDLTPGEITALRDKDVNQYIRKAGLNMSQEGITAAHEFIDVTRGIDWTQVRIQEAVFFRLKNAPKVPFTNPGVGLIENEVKGVLELGVTNTVFTDDPAPTTTVPDVADVPTVDKAERLLPDVKFSAVLAGAIHFVEIDGTVSV
ncbi:MAG: DUF3383 family protein [Nitrospinaceae bacterium]|nr:DUF3383 domain-containing protein [Deltaproteobacteria bacterium]NIY14226.1 DUF3383 family protein [Nitrospinaceae bacterium]